MAGPTIRASDILKPRNRQAHSTAANVGTTTAAVGIGTWAGSASGEPMVGMATTIALKWLGGVARDKLADYPTGWRKYLWKALSLLG